MNEKEGNPTTDECGNWRQRPEPNHQFMCVSGITNSERCYLKPALQCIATAFSCTPHFCIRWQHMPFPYLVLYLNHTAAGKSKSEAPSIASEFALGACKARLPGAAAPSLRYPALWPAVSASWARMLRVAALQLLCAGSLCGSLPRRADTSCFTREVHRDHLPSSQAGDCAGHKAQTKYGESEKEKVWNRMGHRA